MSDFSLSGAESAHIPALDGAPEPTQEQPEVDAVEVPALEDSPEPEASEPEEDMPSEDGSEPAPAPADDPYLKEFIARTKLDPNDPEQLKTLQTLVNQKKYIDQLKAEATRAKSGQADEDGDLTPFEREVLAKQTPKSEAREAGDQPQHAIPLQYQDIGQQWQTAGDAYKALNDAWTKANENGDMREVNAVEAAIFARRADAIVLPRVQQLVEQLLQERVGDVVPAMRQQQREVQLAGAAESAIKELSSLKGYEGVNQLNVEDGGPPIVVDGQEYRPTPLNRIIAENQWIQYIKRDHADPAVADRLTYTARLKAAHKIFSSSKVSQAKAAQLVDTGKAIADKQQKERVRQSMNSGSGAGTTLKPQASKGGNYVEELLGLSEYGDAPRSFASL